MNTKMKLDFDVMTKNESSGLSMGVIKVPESIRDNSQSVILVGEDDNFLHLFYSKTGGYCGITKGSLKYEELITLNSNSY